MPRPALYSDAATVSIDSRQAESKLQVNSDRRAIINVIVENGGAMTLKQLRKHFGYDIRTLVNSLVKLNWLRVEE